MENEIDYPINYKEKFQKLIQIVKTLSNSFMRYNHSSILHIQLNYHYNNKHISNNDDI